MVWPFYITQVRNPSPHPSGPQGPRGGRCALCSHLPFTVISEVKSLSRARLLPTPWTAAYQAPPSMGFSRQEYWSGLPFPFHSH